MSVATMDPDVHTTTNDNVNWQYVRNIKSSRRRRARRTTYEAVDNIHPTLRRIHHLVNTELSAQKQKEYTHKFAPIMTEVVGKNRIIDPYLMEAIDTRSWRSIRKFDTVMVDALLHRSVELDTKHTSTA